MALEFLNLLSKDDLKQLCIELSIQGYSGKNKDELIALIKTAASASADVKNKLVLGKSKVLTKDKLLALAGRECQKTGIKFQKSMKKPELISCVSHAAIAKAKAKRNSLESHGREAPKKSKKSAATSSPSTCHVASHAASSSVINVSISTSSSALAAAYHLAQPPAPPVKSFEDWIREITQKRLEKNEKAYIDSKYSRAFSCTLITAFAVTQQKLQRSTNLTEVKDVFGRLGIQADTADPRFIRPECNEQQLKATFKCRLMADGITIGHFWLTSFAAASDGEYLVRRDQLKIKLNGTAHSTAENGLIRFGLSFPKPHLRM